MSGDITYHFLGPENANQIRDADVFDGPVKAEFLQEFLNSPNHFLIFASFGTRVVGFAFGLIHAHPDKAPTLFIAEVGVEEDMRRQGIASRVTQKLMDHAGSLGVESAWLATENDNTPARKLYQKLNARESEGIVVYDWGGAMDGV